MERVLENFTRKYYTHKEQNRYTGATSGFVYEKGAVNMGSALWR
jgi:hypothetical protein